MAAPAMIGEIAAREPVLPVMRSPDQSPVCLLVILGRIHAAPGQCAEPRVAFVQQGARPRARTFQADPDIGGERQRQVAFLGRDRGLVVTALGVLPAGPDPAIVEHRLAVDDELRGAADTAHGPQQRVLGVVVGRWPGVRAAAGMLVSPRAHEQAVPDDDPALTAVPAGLDDHRAWQVATVGRLGDVFRAELEPAGVPVEQRAEHARAVQPWQAHPLDRAAGRDEGSHLAVRQEGVISDWREWRRRGEGRHLLVRGRYHRRAGYHWAGYHWAGYHWADRPDVGRPDLLVFSPVGSHIRVIAQAGGWSTRVSGLRSGGTGR